MGMTSRGLIVLLAARMPLGHIYRGCIVGVGGLRAIHSADIVEKSSLSVNSKGRGKFGVQHLGGRVLRNEMQHHDSTITLFPKSLLPKKYFHFSRTRHAKLFNNLGL
jgi:hypothetical protein